MENRKINRRIKAVFRTCLEQWKGELLTPRTYMGYLVGISMVLIIAGNYMGYANGRNVQILSRLSLPCLIPVTAFYYAGVAADPAGCSIH